MGILKRIVEFLRAVSGALWKFFVGGVIVAVGFFSNFFDLRQPLIAIEITEIQQKTSADIDVQSSPSFTKFRELMSGDFDYRYNSQYLDGDIFKSLQTSHNRRAQEISDEERTLITLRASAEKIPRNTKSKLSENERTMARHAEGDKAIWGRYKDSLLANMSYDEAKQLLDRQQSKVESNHLLLKRAQEEIEVFRTKSEKTDAKIVVTAAITNSGDGSITLKPQALLRTDLGQGNYLDINLKILSPERNSEIKPRGASIATFQSPPISQMAPQDQERFLSFFKNTSPTNPFVVDVRNNYHRSNTIPFAQGIYEQKIFDGLKGYASQLARKQ